MKWYVYRHNINAGKIEKFNVFDHGGYRAAIEELLQTSLSKVDFASALKSETMYYFWSKCEYEVVITSWPPRVDKKEIERLIGEDVKYSTYVNPTVGEKIDIYDQLKMNWDAFVSYVWSLRNRESDKPNA